MVLAIGCAHEVRPPVSVVVVEGSLQGVVSDAVSRERLRGVRVTVTSPTLGGPRQAFTDENGVYLVRHLPPGDHYRVSFAYRRGLAAHDNIQVTADRITPVFQMLDVNGSATSHGVPWCDSLDGRSSGVCFP